ncbi:facilitated trehalose transporter Tret1 [Apis mellifera]|uniref:Facilitated trehalose transporter Tret1 n=1 Tax=Apis mellifera TaxID=7460 RepID=A0A7M7INR9_APIME|nr:facilitated trehalose transporter Tret1 [Apis mellifera]XP_624322.1 facilitated trehalose transporter Tret1 [Apis mellifera]|eukprot:XP_016773033.1 facilitated trehalose transporter Tret1 [Apis mellifera]
MNENHLGISQQILISNTGDQVVSSTNRLVQYIASLASTLGALAAGMTLAWTSSAGDDGKNLESLYDIHISKDEFSWISSLVAIGSAVICIPIGILTDMIGRKYSMLLMVVPFTIGWLLIIFAKSVIMFYIGRFITGLSGGAFCVAAPIYTAEIAENEIRGTLGSYFQLLLTTGILLSYILGTFVNMRILSIISALVPLIFFVVFMFMPESPSYYLKKGNEKFARKNLIKLRGIQYNIENELQNQKDALEETNKNSVSFWILIKSKTTLKSFIIAYGLMFFQQLSGVNVVIFYTNSIFEKANTGLNPSYSTIIVGVMQVLAVFVSTLIVDHAGRRILLLISIIFLCLTSCTLGIYFYLLKNEVDVNSIKWLPLVSVCIFIIMFNMGFGPLPWMMMGEIFAPEVKSVAASSACLFNWILVFIVTKFFSDLSKTIDLDATFWLFAVICLIGTFFVYFIVPETKGKSLEEIQRELNNL